MLSKFFKLILVGVVIIATTLNFLISAGGKCVQLFCPNGSENCFSVCGDAECIGCTQIGQNWCTEPGPQGYCCSAWRCICKDAAGPHPIEHTCCEFGCPIEG